MTLKETEMEILEILEILIEERDRLKRKHSHIKSQGIYLGDHEQEAIDRIKRFDNAIDRLEKTK